MTTLSFKYFVEQNVGRHGLVLIYAILEFVMVLFLLIDGCLAFFSAEFAKFFELEIPCFLCTRIDLVLVHGNSTSYYNCWACESHKKDISSLEYCRAHKVLANITTMCEGCLISFATEKNSIDCDSNDPKTAARFSKGDFEGDSVIQRCSCCGEFLKKAGNLRSLSMKTAMVPPPSLSPTPRACKSTEEAPNLELPHIHYTELKLTPDNDSAFPDDADVSNGECTAGGETSRSTAMPFLPDYGDLQEDACKSPIFSNGNKFFSNSTPSSPRRSYTKSRKMSVDFLSDITDTNEGDSDILYRLKRQVRLDRRSLMALYMELDEERSASAIAMITRLQAEKAAVQMEALQSQRVMEEHAEYYREELQVMKDLLLKREEEMKVLESELEIYREKHGPISKAGSDVCELDADEDYQGTRSQCLSPFSEKSDPGNPDETDHDRAELPKHSGENANVNLEDSSLENERSRLLSLLSNFEKKFHSSPDEGSLLEKSDVVEEEDQLDWGNEGKVTLTREMSVIRERLRSIEAESGFIKHAAMTLQRGDEGIKLLTEIADNLRKLRAL